MRILIADDNDVSLAMVRSALVKWGHEVVSVPNGTETLALLQREDAPQLAIVDVDMPGLTGIEVCQKLRENPPHGSTYIILLTGNTDKKAVVAGLEAGADDYITKPYDNDELRARINVGVRMTELRGSLSRHIRVLQDTFGQLERSSTFLTQLNGKMVKEISDRTRAEEELRLQKVLLESQSEASLDGVLVISVEGKIISHNHHFLEIWGMNDDVLATRSGAAALRAIAGQLYQPDEFLELADFARQDADERSDREIGLKDGRVVQYYSAPVKSSDNVRYGRVSYFRDITERKHSEAEKARAEEQLRRQSDFTAAVTASLAEGVIALDQSGELTFMNPAAEAALGWSQSDLLGHDLHEVIHSEHAAGSKSECPILTVLHTGLTFQVESDAFTCKDGTLLPVSFTSSPINTGGKIVGAVLAFHDNTERKRAEGMQIRRVAQLALRSDINRALAESNVPLQRIIERCSQAVVQHLDIAFARIWTLNRDENMLELQASSGLYTHINGPHARVPVGKFKIGQIAQERRPHTTNEVQDDASVGDKEWARQEGMIAFAGYPLIVEDRLVGVMAMFARKRLLDDTLDALATAADSISQGIERKQAQEELRESEERYRLLFENNPHPMWVFDVETLAFSDVNEAAVGHYGYSREEFLSMTVKDIRPTEEVPALLEHISMFSGGIDNAGIWKHRKKDGRVIDVEITSHRFLFAGRRSELVLANDVTDRQMLEVQLRHGQKLESIGQLAAGISHEINTPTQYVGDNTRFLRDAFQDLLKVHQDYFQLAQACRTGTSTAELLATVEASAKEADVDFLVQEIPKAIAQSLEGTERIAKIVQSMKDFAHPGTAVKQACDLNKAIDSTITVACSEWKYVANIVTHFDATLPLVPCLQGEFNQVMLNMIINASHAISDVIGDGSAGKGTITISTSRIGPWAEIRIGDTGTGIPEANRARIFDPFFTTKQVGKGTGQGLSISHNVIVDKHGGTITLETAEGAGTTFIIRLPLSEAAKTPEGLLQEAA